MSQRAFNLSAFVLISSIVVHLALPLTSGVICSQPDVQSQTATLALSTLSSEAPMPSFAVNDSTTPAEYPEVEPQTGAPGVTTNTVWDPLLMTLSLPSFVLRFPLAITAERLATNRNALLIWRPPIHFPSSL